MEKYDNYSKDLQKDIHSIIEVYAHKLNNDKDITSYEMVAVLTGGLIFPFLEYLRRLNMPLKNVQKLVEDAYNALVDEEGGE